MESRDVGPAPDVSQRPHYTGVRAHCARKSIILLSSDILLVCGAESGHYHGRGALQGERRNAHAREFFARKKGRAANPRVRFLSITILTVYFGSYGSKKCVSRAHAILASARFSPSLPPLPRAPHLRAGHSTRVYSSCSVRPPAATSTSLLKWRRAASRSRASTGIACSPTPLAGRRSKSSRA